MRICIIVTLLVLCSTLHLTQAAGRKKIKSWSTSTTLADSTTSTTTTSTTTTTTTTTSRPITTRSSEKLSYPKKVQSLKKRPTKSSSSGANLLSTKLTQKKRKPTDVTEKFKDLSADDLAFIKELDKQFKLHGDKIKIKVENDNTTTSGKGKNSKRTIEGELGYGYNHNGYNYDPPKFMFYPYSQSDISPDAPGYTPPRAEVEIQPSYSYELHPQSYTVPNEQPQIDLPQVHSGEELSHHHQQQQAPQYDNQQQQQHQHPEEKYSEPVIVLRIPGPAKYASHLQALLQQYLEIRAAQYLRLLEEAELRKQQEQQQQQQQHHQHYEQQQQHDYEQQQHDYAQQEHYGQQVTYNSQPAEDDSAQYAPEVAYAHQVAPTPAPVNYPAIDDVYQGYKARKQHAQHYSQPEEPQAPQQSYYTPEQGYPQAPEEEQQQYYYPQQQQHQQAEQQYEHAQQEPETGGGPHDPAYQQHVYLISMQPQPGYYSAEQSDEEPQPQQHAYEHEHPGPSNENNPRDTHTKVVYSPHAPDAAADYNTMYQLPSIRPYERHAPTSMPAYHQHYHQQQQQAESLDYQRVQAADPQNGAAAQQEPVNITQRPYNYHAHGLRGRTRGRKRGTAVNTATTGDTEQRLDKIREYVREKLGAEMGSAVEIKSTHVINRQA